jgi:hypothetical protein
VVCLLFGVYQWRLYGVLERVVAYASRRLDVSPASRLVATVSVLWGGEASALGCALGSPVMR